MCYKKSVFLLLGVLSDLSILLNFSLPLWLHYSADRGTKLQTDDFRKFEVREGEEGKVQTRSIIFSDPWGRKLRSLYKFGTFGDEYVFLGVGSGWEINGIFGQRKRIREFYRNLIKPSRQDERGLIIWKSIRELYTHRISESWRFGFKPTPR